MWHRNCVYRQNAPAHICHIIWPVKAKMWDAWIRKTLFKTLYKCSNFKILFICFVNGTNICSGHLIAVPKNYLKKNIWQIHLSFFLKLYRNYRNQRKVVALKWKHVQYYLRKATAVFVCCFFGKNDATNACQKRVSLISTQHAISTMNKIYYFRKKYIYKMHRP